MAARLPATPHPRLSGIVVGVGKSRRHADRMLSLAGLSQALPTQAISRLAGVLGRTEIRPVSLALVRAFAHHYGVDLSEAERASPEDYGSFNDFFTRGLKPGARPLPEDEREVVSPADGYISQFGVVEEGRLLQAKGHRFSAAALLTDTGLARRYEGGAYGPSHLLPGTPPRVHCARRRSP